MTQTDYANTNHANAFFEADLMFHVEHEIEEERRFMLTQGKIWVEES